MSQHPRPESRISALEKRASTLEAAIEELSSDQAEELKAIRQEIKQGHIDIGKSLDSHAEALMQEIRKLPTREDLGNLITVQDARFDKIEDDIAELKGLIMQLLQQKGE